MKPAKSQKYYIDTSALIHAKDEYPFANFESFWKRFQEAIDSGTIVSCRPVFEEIIAFDDDLAEWAKKQTALFPDITQEEANFLPELMKKCSAIVNPTKIKDEADPYVVAQGYVNRGVIVTQEKPTGDTKKLKIPDAGRILGIQCFSLVNMIRALGWKI